jgi:hypothetical protein
MTATERSDQLFDALLKAAVREAYEKEIDKLTAGAEQSGFIPSPALDQRIDGFIKRSRRQIKVKRVVKGFGKAAACLCVFLTIASIVLLSVGATRNAILNAVISWQEEYAVIKYEAPAETNSQNIFRPAYLPMGFSENSIKSTDNSTTIIYENKSGDLIFFIQQAAGNASTLVDSENTDYSEIVLAGKTGYLFEAKTEVDSSILVWEENGIAFSLTSAIDSKELVKMGESLKIIAE